MDEYQTAVPAQVDSPIARESARLYVAAMPRLSSHVQLPRDSRNPGAQDEPTEMG